jgi:hypothetical protein
LYHKDRRKKDPSYWQKNFSDVSVGREIVGAHRESKKPWTPAEIIVVCSNVIFSEVSHYMAF